MFDTSCDRELREAREEARRQRERAEQLEQERRDAEEERWNRIERERRESRDRMLQAECEAETWPEAFQKQRRRLQKEIDFCLNEKAAAEQGQYPADDATASDPAWWQKGADDMGRSMAAVNSAEALLEAELSAARLSYEAACKAAREKVALIIDQTYPNDGQNLAQCLRDDDPSALVNW